MNNFTAHGAASLMLALAGCAAPQMNGQDVREAPPAPASTEKHAAAQTLIQAAKFVLSSKPNRYGYSFKVEFYPREKRVTVLTPRFENTCFSGFQTGTFWINEQDNLSVNIEPASKSVQGCETVRFNVDPVARIAGEFVKAGGNWSTSSNRFYLDSVSP